MMRTPVRDNISRLQSCCSHRMHLTGKRSGVMHVLHIIEVHLSTKRCSHADALCLWQSVMHQWPRGDLARSRFRRKGPCWSSLLVLHETGHLGKWLGNWAGAPGRD